MQAQTFSELEVALRPAMQAFENGAVREAFDLATERLSDARTTAGTQWPDLVKNIRASNLFTIGQQCPFTQHAFSRPRGYPGDALLLDWIYRDFRDRKSTR